MTTEHDSSGAQSMRTALILVDRGVLTQKAARMLAHFAMTPQVFCEAMQLPGGEIGIVFRERWYTPAAFNALADDQYPPTASDVATAITAFAAFAEDDAEDAEPAPEEPDGGPDESDASRSPDPDAVVQGLRSGYGVGCYGGYGKDAAAETRLEAHYQASSQHTDGEGALMWPLIVGVALFVAVMVWAFFNGVWR
ncbi:MAG TPA: hypothetical protein VE338_06905 [Ktedonobacterales bacterium]|nr:hypothetical protein [Ktedonobacterales bacterium]